MKVFAWLLAVVGLIGTAAGALLVKNMWDLRFSTRSRWQARPRW
jgi:hypothetical protein